MSRALTTATATAPARRARALNQPTVAHTDSVAPAMVSTPVTV